MARSVSPLNFDGVAANAARTAALSRWRGVALENGENELVAVVRDEHGTEATRDSTRTVHYAGGAVRAEMVRDASTLIGGRPHASGDRTAHGGCIRQAGTTRHARRLSRRSAVSLVVGSCNRSMTTSSSRRARASRRSMSMKMGLHGLDARADDASRHGGHSSCVSMSDSTKKFACGSNRKRAIGFSSVSPKAVLRTRRSATTCKLPPRQAR